MPPSDTEAVNDSTLTATTPSMDLKWNHEMALVWATLLQSNHDASAARQNVDAIAQIRDALGFKKVRIVVDIRGVESISREARTFYGGAYTASVQRATVLLVDSTISRIIANFFMGLNKPLSPTRMFNELGKALEWLGGYPHD